MWDASPRQLAICLRSRRERSRADRAIGCFHASAQGDWWRLAGVFHGVTPRRPDSIRPPALCASCPPGFADRATCFASPYRSRASPSLDGDSRKRYSGDRRELVPEQKSTGCRRHLWQHASCFLPVHLRVLPQPLRRDRRALRPLASPCSMTIGVRYADRRLFSPVWCGECVHEPGSAGSRLDIPP